MRKVYNFKKLTEKVMNVAVLLLMLVMTAGTLFAEEVTIVFSEAGLVNTQVLRNIIARDPPCVFTMVLATLWAMP